MSLIQGGTPPGDVQVRLEEILGRAEFREERDFGAEFLGGFFEWLGELFEIDGAAEASQVGAKVLLVIAGVFAVIGLVWLIWNLAGGIRARTRAVDPVELPIHIAQRVAELRAEARTAESAGDWTLALRLYFFALVVGLGEKGELAYRDAWTNRELLERGDATTRVLDLLSPLISRLDEHSFGLRPTDQAEVQRFAGVCEELLAGGRS